jgi:sugar lactone lactonase YvrE
MSRRLLRSKSLTVAVLLCFLGLLARQSLSQTESQAQSEYTRAFQAGKALYEEGEHKEAVIRFLQALTVAKGPAETGDACFYLSLSYYSLGESDNTLLYLKKMFEAQPEKEIDARLFPSGYVTLYYRTRSEFARPKPEEKPKVEAKEAEKKAEAEKQAAAEAPKPQARGGKEETEPKVRKKFPWLIVIGAVVVVGVVAYLLLKKKGGDTGSISVSSTPSGAKVLLDGNDTGQVTACTLSNVSPGAHAVTLVKDGYADYAANVTVTAGETAKVSAALTKNSITVTAPASGTVWAKGGPADIRWTVGGGAASGGQAAAMESSGLRQKDLEAAGKPVNSTSGPETAKETGKLVGSQIRSVVDIAAVKIELIKGGQPAALIAGETPNNGLFTWQVPDSLAEGSDYRVRVSCSTDSDVFGESSSFSIVTGMITVLAPTAGSVWGKGATYGILWTGFVSGNVRIELYKWTSLAETIAADTANDGQHNWTVPLTTADGSDYRIRITAVSHPEVFGESEFFTIGSAYYEFVTKWGGNGAGDGQFYNPGGAAVDASGAVYVADTNNHRIQKFDTNGAFITKWGSYGTSNGQLSCPEGIAFDTSGNIYVAEGCNDRIQKFNAGGTYLAKWGSSGSGTGQFEGPSAIAIDLFGYVFVADEQNDRIQKFTVDGVYLTSWGSRGNGNGQFYYPSGIAVDSSGSVYVADLNNHRVQKFTSTGVFITKWGSYGNGDGQFNGPRGVAVDASGNVYIADWANDRVQKFSPNGAFMGKWGSTGTGDGQFDGPEGIAVDASGNVFVSEWYNHRMQKFRVRSASPSLIGRFMPSPVILLPDPEKRAMAVETGDRRAYAR